MDNGWENNLPILRQIVTINCSTIWLSSMTRDLTDPSNILTLITLSFFLNSNMSWIINQLHIVIANSQTLLRFLSIILDNVLFWFLFVNFLSSLMWLTKLATYQHTLCISVSHHLIQSTLLNVYNDKYDQYTNDNYSWRRESRYSIHSHMSVYGSDSVSVCLLHNLKRMIPKSSKLV